MDRHNALPASTGEETGYTDRELVLEGLRVVYSIVPARNPGHAFRPEYTSPGPVTRKPYKERVESRNRQLAHLKARGAESLASRDQRGIFARTLGRLSFF